MTKFHMFKQVYSFYKKLLPHNNNKINLVGFLILYKYFFCTYLYSI